MKISKKSGDEFNGSTILDPESGEVYKCYLKLIKNNKPKSYIYKDELANQLKNINQSKLIYRLQKYEAHNEKEFLYFHVQGDNLCATIVLTINEWDKLENVRAKKGVSYKGAEFKNLNFEIKKDASSTEFIYKTFDQIID